MSDGVASSSMPTLLEWKTKLEDKAYYLPYTLLYKASCQDATWMCTLEGASDLSNLTDILKYTQLRKKKCPNFPPRPKIQSAQEEILSVTLLKVSRISLTYIYPNS